MQAYSNVYERYFDPECFAPGSPKTAGQELPRACAYRALMSLKYKYHQDDRQPKSVSDLPTSAPLFSHEELRDRAEEVILGWTGRHPAQVSGTTDDVAAEARHQADQLWDVWSNRRGGYSEDTEAENHTDTSPQQQNHHASVPLSKLDQSYHTPKRGVSPVPNDSGDLRYRPPTESPDYDPGPSSKIELAAAAAAGTVGGGGGALAAFELARQNAASGMDPAARPQSPTSPDNDPKRVSNSSQPPTSRPLGSAPPAGAPDVSRQPTAADAAVAGTQQPQPNTGKTIKIAENGKRRSDQDADAQNGKSRNTGGTKDHIAEQAQVNGNGGLTGNQPVGKIDLKHL